MKTLILATAVALGLAGTASAFEINNALRFDNTITAEYSAETSKITSSYEGELVYQINSDFSAYVYTEIDLRDVAFQGINLGVDYNPAAFNYVTLTGEIQLDDNFEYSDAVAIVEIKF